MASVAHPAPRLPANAAELWQFLKSELTPRPGFYPIFARVLIALVITFLLVTVFRIPYAAITLFSVFTIDRSSRRAALVRSLESVAAISIATVIAFADLVMFVQLPLLWFVSYGLELFVVAFLIRTTRLQGPAMNMGMTIYTIHNVWERAYPASPHVEQTLWAWLSLCLGFVVSLAVEFALVRENPVAQIQAGLTSRLNALVNFYRALGEGREASAAKQAVSSYAIASTSGIRSLVALLRTTDDELREPLLALNTFTAAVARLIDVSATIDSTVMAGSDEARRFLALAAELECMSSLIAAGRTCGSTGSVVVGNRSRVVPALPELERTAAMMPQAFSAIASEADDPAPQHVPDPEKVRIFIPDALTNPAHLLFALKTAMAAMTCYVLYSGLAWPGISTSVVTVLVTALNTGGATRQKQLLRLGGAVCGGLIALGSIVFLLPEIYSITGVTILVAAVSAFSAWFAISGPRVSYFGLQTALAFYLALIQDYRTTTELTPARDRAIGVLLGLVVMWVVFDNLWPESAVQEMRVGFTRNVRLLAEVIGLLDEQDRMTAIRRMGSLRDQIQSGFATVNGHADSVLFEFGGPNRERDLELRNSILRLQASLRTLLVVEVAVFQYRVQLVPGTRPQAMSAALRELDEALRDGLLEIASAVDELRAAHLDTRLDQAMERLSGAVTESERTLSNEWIKSRIEGIRALLQQEVQLTKTLGEECLWC